MEVIRLPGYTPEEKEVIARRYLVPRQIEECGLTQERVQVSRAAVREVISGYTQEAGVRGLEREIGRLLRKIARRIAEGETERVSVNCATCALPAAPLLGENIPRSAEAVSRAVSPGRKRAAKARRRSHHGARPRARSPARRRDEGVGRGASYALARRRLGTPRPAKMRSTFTPAGATPKDGPGRITMARDRVAGTGIPADVAMTARSLLRGRVLPVGGVREKARACAAAFTA
jgi:ATP-dependent Lon protease